jgi:hypothetical protein
MIGHNNPPSLIDDALAPFGDTITEAENWLDGSPVETEAQMLSVDALTKDLKAAKKAVEAAKEEEYRPFKIAGDAVIARYKPTLDDIDRMVKGLVAAVDGFKRKLAAEKEAARKEAERLAWEKTRAAQEAARQADASNIEAQRAADQAMRAAEEAQRQATLAKADTVKGMRTITRTVIVDPVALARWLWANDRAAQEEFQADRARKLALHLPGVVEQVKEKVAV